MQNNFLILLTCHFLISVFLFFIVIKYSNYLRIFNQKKQIQNIHIGEISRLGGLIIFLNLVSIFYFIKNYEILWLLFISLIILIPAVIEDLNVNLPPIIRLINIIFFSGIVIFNLETLPIFNFYFLENFFNSETFKFIFFSLALCGVINGQNIIDGTNGLSVLTGISIFGCILYLGFYLNDDDLITTSLIIIFILVSFLLFNFPFGKIFLGDSGSYLIGLLAGYLIIKTFAIHENLPSWSAVIILYYPTMETIFSFCRKIYNKKSPFKADNKHLHIMIFLLISKNFDRPKLFNSLVAPFLSIIWLTPLAVLPITLELPIISFLVLLILTFTYFFFYKAVPKPDEDL